MCEPKRGSSALLAAGAVAVVAVAGPVTAVAGSIAAAVVAAEVAAALVIVAAVWLRLRQAVPRTVPARMVPRAAITRGQRAIEGRVIVPGAVPGAVREVTRCTVRGGSRS